MSKRNGRGRLVTLAPAFFVKGLLAYEETFLAPDIDKPVGIPWESIGRRGNSRVSAHCEYKKFDL